MTEWTGERARARNRKTHTTVVLVDAAAAELDASGGQWATVCDDHSTVVNHDRIVNARWYMHHPEDWCEECMGVTQ